MQQLDHSPDISTATQDAATSLAAAIRGSVFTRPFGSGSTRTAKRTTSARLSTDASVTADHD